MKNNNCYDIKIVNRYNVEIWILIKISVHKNIGRLGADLHLGGVTLLLVIIVVIVILLTSTGMTSGIPDIKVSVVKRKKKFLMKYVNSANRLCQLFSVDALSECSSYV